jgi:hypothetical protein
MRGAAGGDEAALLRAFFTFWALKEAYIKVPFPRHASENARLSAAPPSSILPRIRWPAESARVHVLPLGLALQRRRLFQSYFTPS